MLNTIALMFLSDISDNAVWGEIIIYGTWLGTTQRVHIEPHVALPYDHVLFRLEATPPAHA
jgi:hypothetical protein